MYLVLTHADLARLTPQTRNELLQLMFSGNDSDFDDIPSDNSMYWGEISLHEPEYEEWGAPTKTIDKSTGSKVVLGIDESQARGLVSNLSSKSIETLKFFAGDDPVRLDSLVGDEKIYENFSDLKRSFVGAVNRRLRTVTGNRSAVLFKKVETTNGICIAVKEQTAFALRQVLL